MNSDYTAAPTVQQTITVGKAAQAITFTSTPPTTASTLKWAATFSKHCTC